MILIHISQGDNEGPGGPGFNGSGYLRSIKHIEVLSHQILFNLHLVFYESLNVDLRRNQGLFGDEKSVSAGFVSDKLQAVFEIVREALEQFLQFEFGPDNIFDNVINGGIIQDQVDIVRF